MAVNFELKFGKEKINKKYKTDYKIVIPFNDQLDTQFFFLYVCFNSLHVSSIQVLIIRRFNCINAISGICHSDRLVCRFGRPSKPAYQTVTYIE